MSEDYQVLTYRVQRNEGRGRLQRVVIDADAHRVDLRGELRLTQEVKAISASSNKAVTLTLSPAPLGGQTLPVVVGTLAMPEGHESMSNTQLASMTLGLYSAPSRRLHLEEALDASPQVDSKTMVWAEAQDEAPAGQHTLDQPISHDALMQAAQELRQEAAPTTTHEELAQIKHVRQPEAVLPMAQMEATTGDAAALQRPSWHTLNMQDEAPARRHRRRRQQTVTSLLLLAAAACTSALLWLKYIAA